MTILVNNAGIADQSFVLELADEHIEKCLQINTISNFWVRIELITSKAVK